jgi:hypothetical protein
VRPSSWHRARATWCSSTAAGRSRRAVASRRMIAMRAAPRCVGLGDVAGSRDRQQVASCAPVEQRLGGQLGAYVGDSSGRNLERRAMWRIGMGSAVRSSPPIIAAQIPRTTCLALSARGADPDAPGSGCGYVGVRDQTNSSARSRRARRSYCWTLRNSTSWRGSAASATRCSSRATRCPCPAERREIPRPLVTRGGEQAAIERARSPAQVSCDAPRTGDRPRARGAGVR